MRILLVALLLVGCAESQTGLGTYHKVPPVPDQLNDKIGSLPPNSDLTMAGQIRDNNRNIRAYNETGFKYNRLLEYYNCVREAINERKEPKCQ